MYSKCLSQLYLFYGCIHRRVYGIGHLMSVEQNVLIDRLSGREEVKERRFLALATKSSRMPQLQSGFSSVITRIKEDVPCCGIRLC